MNKQKVYFPNLNGLRFIAALLVIVHHIEQFKSISNITSYWGVIPFIGIIGKLGVILFFVLSGFLITYLLLTEEHEYKTISIRKFYIRRILRIWPLYFLIISLALFVLPNIGIFVLPGFEKDVIYKDLLLKIVLYFCFLPNLVLFLVGMVPYASQTWSIGTEEQFYLLWPVMLKFFKKQRILLMMTIICLYFIVKFALKYYCNDYDPSKQILKGFWSSFNIDCMAIGGIYAILLFKRSAFLTVLMNQYLFYLAIIITVVLIVAGIEIPFIHYEFYALLFGIIILNFAANKKIIISLENRVFNYLGKISYGLYMYHPVGIILSLWLAVSLGHTTNWLLYPLSVIMTIGIASFSYKYYESLFLKIKQKYANVASGD
jgi:peptidoglycan/LPS O-acetylase OafA/YrhL